MPYVSRPRRQDSLGLLSALSDAFAEAEADSDPTGTGHRLLAYGRQQTRRGQAVLPESDSGDPLGDLDDLDGNEASDASPQRRARKRQAVLHWLSALIWEYNLTPAAGSDRKVAAAVAVKDLLGQRHWLTLLYGIEQDWPDTLIAEALHGEMTLADAIALNEDPVRQSALSVLGAFRHSNH